MLVKNSSSPVILRQKKKLGVLRHPSMSVEGHSLSADYTKDPNSIFKMLCQTMTNEKPDVCQKVNILYDPLKNRLPDSTNQDFVKLETLKRYKEFD